VERLSQRGNLDVYRMLGDWFGDPAWQRDAGQVASEARRLLLSEIGRDAIHGDIGNFASELHWNLELVDWIWTLEERTALALDHAHFLFASLSDSVDFATGQYVKTDLECCGGEHLQMPREAGRGIILVSVFQTHPGYAFVSPALSQCRIGVVRKALGAGASLALDGLPDTVAELPASAAAVRSLLQSLRDGGVIAAYCDYVYDGSGTIDAPMFGAHATVSRSLLKIAMQTNAAIVPMAVARVPELTEDVVRVEFFPDITAGNTAALELVDLSFRLGIALECLIRRYPAHWRLWNTLRDRLH
jgi:hypothetical protein